MEENLIRISEINDFIFCPISIYFHKLMGDFDTIYYHTEKQINGKNVHKAIDYSEYSTSRDVITSLDVYSSEYGLIGKIDILNTKKCELVERKYLVKNIYDGYIFQLYAQYICLKEMGYEVNKIKIISYQDKKSYNIDTPENNEELYKRFKETIKSMKNFNFELYKQRNIEKCRNCIYENICDRSLL